MDEGAIVLTLASFSLLDELIALAFASKACKDPTRYALRRVRLQCLGAAAPAAALRRLLGMTLTDRGAALVELDTSFCRSIGNEALKLLPKLPALVSLNLDGCQDIDDDGLLAVAQRCQSLESLSLYWNVKATDKGFGKILRAQKGQSLHTLNFSGCKNLTDETIQRLAGRGQNLEVLDLTRCPQVTDIGIRLVGECLDKLRVLRLYAMAQLSAAAFASLQGLLRLEELDLCGCHIKDQALIDYLATAAPSKLHTLNLTWCPSLTDAAAAAVARDCPRLDWLSYFGNTNITGAAVEALSKGPSGRKIRSLDVRGLTKALPYSTDSQALKKLFSALVVTELHR